MTRPELFIRKTDFNTTVRMPHVSDIMHPHFRVSKKSPHLATDELLQQYMNEETYSDYFVNLSPYINDSGVCVPLHFSLHRAYILFRTLGLRHMTVVTHTNQVEGILTRKDLMGFAIGEKLERLLTNPPRKLSRSVVLALRKNYGHKHQMKAKDNNANGNSENTASTNLKSASTAQQQQYQPQQSCSSNNGQHTTVEQCEQYQYQDNNSTAGATSRDAQEVTVANVSADDSAASASTAAAAAHGMSASSAQTAAEASEAYAAAATAAADANHLPTTSETVINSNHHLV